MEWLLVDSFENLQTGMGGNVIGSNKKEGKKRKTGFTSAAVSRLLLYNGNLFPIYVPKDGF